MGRTFNSLDGLGNEDSRAEGLLLRGCWRKGRRLVLANRYWSGDRMRVWCKVQPGHDQTMGSEGEGQTVIWNPER